MKYPEYEPELVYVQGSKCGQGIDTSTLDHSATKPRSKDLAKCAPNIIYVYLTFPAIIIETKAEHSRH